MNVTITHTFQSVVVPVQNNITHLLQDVLSAVLAKDIGETDISSGVPPLPTGVDCWNNCFLPANENQNIS